MSWMVAAIDARGGAVPFDEFMGLALYHPEHGYYSGEEPRYGRAGDFLTAPTASEWYPRVIARLAASCAREFGTLRLLDVASGDGAFIAGVLDALDGERGEVLEGVDSVERSDSMRQLQELRFRGLRLPLTITGDLESLEIEGGPCLVHASELYDALPVARVVGCGGGRIEESWVASTGGRLEWQYRVARDQVEGYFNRHGVTLAEGQIAEANLGAEGFHHGLLEVPGRAGLVIVLDYGYETRRLYDPRGRAMGSLSTYAGHRLGRDPLVSPGEVDLTAHVNWDDLRAAAVSAGWEEIGLWPLAEFLVRAGLADELSECGLGMEADLDAATVGARQEVKRLLDPEGMGSDLKVLVQGKGMMIDAARSALDLA